MTKTNPLSLNDIKKITQEIRSYYNIKEDEAFPIYDVLEKLHNLNALTIQIIDNDDPMLDENTPAVYNSCDNFIYLKESVLEDLENNEYRANFTLAHEYFHYLQIQVLQYEYENVETCKPYEEIDWQANEFAGELLCPVEYLDLEEHILAEKFKISLECALTRKVMWKKRLERKNTK